MKRTYLMTTAVALLLITSVAGFQASADSQDPASEITMADGEAMLDHEGDYEEFDCEPEPQLALVVTDVPGCNDFGEHTRGGYMILGFHSIDAGNVGPVPLTGTVQALVEHDGGEVDFRCTWDAGEFQGCDVESAVWPDVGATFTFSCQSMEGSIGNWGECYIGHA